MKRYSRGAAVLMLLFVFSGCAGGNQPKPDWQTAPDADIPGLSSFGWSGSYGSPVAILDTQIRDALRAELLKKGYIEASDHPDFLVSYESVESAVVKEANPVRIGIGVGSWGGNVGGSVGTSVDVGGEGEVLQQNRVTVRAIDPTGNRELWIGTTTTFEERPDAGVVNRAIAGVMQGFPARRH